MAKTPKKKRGYHAGKIPGMNYIQSIQLMQQAKESVTDFAKDETQRVLADRQAQRMSWLYLIALNDMFGFGKERLEKLEQSVKELAAEYNHVVKVDGQDYADEKLRQRVSRLRGYDVRYLYEDQLPVNPERDPASDEPSDETTCAALREADNRIY